MLVIWAPEKSYFVRVFTVPWHKTVQLPRANSKSAEIEGGMEYKTLSYAPPPPVVHQIIPPF